MTNARNSDPETSHKAAKDISRADRALVYAMFHKYRKLADFQLEELLGGRENGRWRKRRCDLKRDGVLADSGVRIVSLRTDKKVIVWIMKVDLTTKTDAAQMFVEVFK